jgi:beta-lactamase regulating signal transducer with metallopeptidase domain
LDSDSGKKELVAMAHITDVLVSFSPAAAVLAKVTVLLAVGWAIHGALSIKQSDARWRLLLWRGLIAGLLLVPAIQWLSGWRILLSRPATLRTETAIVTPAEKAAVPARPISSAAPAPASMQKPLALNITGAPLETPRISIFAWAGERIPQLLLVAWLIGIGVLLLRTWALLSRLRRMRSASRPAAPNFQSFLDRIGREMGCKKPALLRFASDIESPFLIGLWRPAIVLPDRMASPEYGDDLPGVLAHEAAHVRMHDLGWMALGRFVSTLLWFHPLAWRLRAAHTAACEEACDAAAAKYVGNPAAYSSTLARVALAIVRPVPSAGGIPMARSSQIISRLRLLERRAHSYSFRRSWVLLSIAFGAVALAALAGIRVAYAADTQSTAPKYTVTVEGVITDAVTGKPVSGADVRGWVCVGSGPDRPERCAEQQVKTDDAGRYELTLNTAFDTSGETKGEGLVALSVKASDYGTQPVFVKPWGKSKKLNFTNVDVALNQGRKIFGRIVNAQNQPVAGARLAVHDGLSGGWDDWGAWGSATSGENGQFEIWLNRERPKDMASNPWLIAVKPGAGTAVRWGILKEDSLGDIMLNPGGTAAGKVVDGRGNAVSGCTVNAFHYPFGRLGQTTTDANGHWEMTGLPSKTALADFIERKTGRKISSFSNTDIYVWNGTRPEFNYVRGEGGWVLSPAPDAGIAVEENSVAVVPDIVLGAQAAREKARENEAKMPTVDPLKAEMMGRVEDFFMHNYRDVTSRKTLAWSDVTKDADGNLTIHYKYLATIWNRDKMIIEDIFTFDSKGNFVSVKKAEGYPQKYAPEPADTSTQEGLKKLVEKFFSENFRDVTARKTVEWGQREAKPDGNVSIRYMYEATIWGKDKLMMNQVFTFNVKGEYVSYENVAGYPKDVKE